MYRKCYRKCVFPIRMLSLMVLCREWLEPIGYSCNSSSFQGPATTLTFTKGKCYSG